jgi:hypothetical protein
MIVWSDPSKRLNSPVEQWAAIFQSSRMTDLSSWGHETNYPLLKRVLEAAGQVRERFSDIP